MEIQRPSVLSLVLLLAVVLTQGDPQEVSVKVIFFGYPDNSPPNSDAISYTGVRSRIKASGTGSFSDPITFAAAKPQDLFKIGIKIYVPYLRKYFIMEEICTSCVKNEKISLWIGGKGCNKEQVQNCEAMLTKKDPVIVIIDPPNDKLVDLGSFMTCPSYRCFPTMY